MKTAIPFLELRLVGSVMRWSSLPIFASGVFLADLNHSYLRILLLETSIVLFSLGVAIGSFRQEVIKWTTEDKDEEETEPEIKKLLL